MPLTQSAVFSAISLFLLAYGLFLFVFSQDIANTVSGLGLMLSGASHFMRSQDFGRFTLSAGVLLSFGVLAIENYYKGSHFGVFFHSFVCVGVMFLMARIEMVKRNSMK